MKLTEVLAIYAAMLSTIVFLWNIVNSLPSIKVEIGFGSASIIDGYLQGIYIVVKNPSSKTVHLSSVQILLPYESVGLFQKIKWALKHRRSPTFHGWIFSGLDLYKISDGCPVELKPGTSHKIFIEEKIIHGIFEEYCCRSLKAVAQDQLGKKRYSRKFKYTIGFAFENVEHNKAM